MEKFQPGDRVLLVTDERRVEAEVMIASPCGRSLMVAFEAIVSGHVGMMPLLAEGDGFISVVTGEPVHLGRLGDG